MLALNPIEDWRCSDDGREIEAIGTCDDGQARRCRVTLAAVADWFDCEMTPEACLEAVRYEAATLAASWSVRAAVRAFEADGSVLIE